MKLFLLWLLSCPNLHGTKAVELVKAHFMSNQDLIVQGRRNHGRGGTISPPSSTLAGVPENIDNVLKSRTLLSFAPECHSQNREPRRSATPFYQKERCGSGTHILEESENMSGPLLSLFFFWNFLFFWHSFSVNKLVSPSLLWFIYSWKQRYFQLDIKFLVNFQIQVCILVRKKIFKKITKKER